MTSRPTGPRPQGPRQNTAAAAVPPPLPRTGPPSAQPVQQPQRPPSPPISPPMSGSASKRARRGKVWLGNILHPRMRRHGRVVAKGAIYALVPILMLIVLAIGILYVRLRHGPIAFDLFVAPIERGINAELDTYQVDIKGSELRLGKDGGLEFRLRDLSVLDGNGAVVATSPLSAVGLSMPALWRGRIAPERVTLIDPEINLAFSEETGLALAVARPPAPSQADSVQKNAEEPKPDEPAPPQAPTAETSPHVPLEPLNFAKVLSGISARARHREGAGSYLTELGIENANVVLDYAGRRSSWRIDEANVDFNHRKRRSVISGRVAVASQNGPWSLTFVTDESEKTDKIAVKTTIRDLVPATLAAAAPPLALLGMLDVPIAGDATVEISTSGEIESSEIALQAGAGRIIIPGVTADPFQLTAGLFRVKYDGKARVFELSPSPVKWADGNIMFSGTAKDISGERGPPVWRYTLDGRNGMLEAAEFNVPSVPLEQWSVIGSIIPRHGVVEVGDFRVKGGGAEVAMKGMTRAGPNGQSSRAEVTISEMPLATLKAIWPSAVAHGARQWVGERVTAANFKGGSFKFTSGEFLEGEAPAVGQTSERMSASFEVVDASAVPLDGMTTMTAPRALITLQNNALEVMMPDAFAVLSGNRKMPIKSAKLTAADVVGPRPDGELTLSVQSQLGPFLEVMEGLPVRAVREAAPFPKAGDGKVDAQFKIKLPLVAELKADDVVIEGKARISDGRFGKVGGQFDVQGFTLNLELSQAALDAKGDLLINGVPAKIVGQRIFGAGSEQQPPLRVTANLDDSDRNQLGLDINDLVHGTVPVDITLQKGERPEPVIKLKADLTNAELMIDAVSWHKAQGRPAVFEADVAPGKTHKTELQNFKVSGDDVAIEGWVGIGADSKMKEFYFPQMTLNVVSRLEVQGVRGNDGIWNVKARGKNFDGRDLFKSLYSMNDAQKPKAAKPPAGIDLSAEVDNVMGASDLSLRGLKVKLSSRQDKLTALEARGTVEGGSQLAAVLDKSTGPRRLLADSTDAGAALKLIGFYPNIQGGRLKLEVNLDGKGAAEKTGVLWVDDFRVLGDPIVSEVVGSADQGRPAIGGQRHVTREVFEFSRMRAPFSIGYGQFVLEDSYVRGPMMGANLTGKVDFKTRRINLGGTYIPLQGLNSALGGIPLLGQIISGTKGEGIFGITFGIQGPIERPQVLVNPLSLVAPGIFREIFQMTNPNPKVQARDDKPAKPVEERVRASAPEVAPPPVIVEKAPSRAQGGASSGARESIDGWSSMTAPGGRD